MKNAIIRYKIKCLWHFTDQSNLDSIKQHGGLLSLAELNKRGIEVPEPGGNEISHQEDKQKGLDNYIHLTFYNANPMLWVAQKKENRIPNPKWLEINRDLLFGKDVLFCKGVANKREAELIDATEAEKQIDFETLFEYTNCGGAELQAHREAQKSEILIPNFISLKHITIT